MKQELINKYSVAVPRYTSYPPANFFNNSFKVDDYKHAILESNGLDPKHISIYIHIPFCYRMCYYCGCNAMLMQKKEVVDSYINALKKELKMVFSLLDKNRKVSQIHYGGGSPTSLDVSVLKEINELILSEFQTIDKPEIAIECHPGYLDHAYWKALAQAGFNRISLGIQDFDEQVLKISNRKPSLIPVEDIVAMMRAENIALNMDFIYGLPSQTPDTFAQTITRAIEMHPDRVVTFSYAHVPWVNKLQLKLEEVGLPSAATKSELYETAQKLLRSSGYECIGMDHFVLRSDELFTAQTNKELHRNFQGYCTRRTTGQVYAFGTTAISQLTGAYSQNTKDINEYIKSVNNNVLPVLKGYNLTLQEQLAGKIIAALMCNYRISWQEIATDSGLSVEEVKAFVNYNENVLADFAQDGIIEYTTDYIVVLPEYAPLVRNVAASLDPLMVGTDKKFSKSV